jgi:hypothetical protein
LKPILKCVLCGGTSIESKIDEFQLTVRAREILRVEFGVNPDSALTRHAVCRSCLDLSAEKRNELALSVLKSEEQATLILDALKQRGN